MTVVEAWRDAAVDESEDVRLLSCAHEGTRVQMGEEEREEGEEHAGISPQWSQPMSALQGASLVLTTVISGL